MPRKGAGACSRASPHRVFVLKPFYPFPAEDNLGGGFEMIL